MLIFYVQLGRQGYLMVRKLMLLPFIRRCMKKWLGSGWKKNSQDVLSMRGFLVVKRSGMRFFR